MRSLKEPKCPKLPDDHDPIRFLEEYLVREAGKSEDWLKEQLKYNGYNYILMFKGRTLKIFSKDLTVSYTPHLPDYRLFIKGKKRALGMSFREWLMPKTPHVNCRCVMTDNFTTVAEKLISEEKYKTYYNGGF